MGNNKYDAENVKIGQRIRELRKKKDLSASEAAQKILHVAYPTWNDIERGKRPPTAHQVIELARFFKVSTDYLLRGSVPKYTRIEYATGLNSESIENLKSGNVGKEHELYTILCNRFLNDKKLINSLCQYATLAVYPDATPGGERMHETARIYASVEEAFEFPDIHVLPSAFEQDLRKIAMEHQASEALDSFFQDFCTYLWDAEYGDQLRALETAMKARSEEGYHAQE